MRSPLMRDQDVRRISVRICWAVDLNVVDLERMVGGPCSE